METVLSVCLGVGLSAACGFRVFVPLLVMSIAAVSGHLTLAPGFEWIGTYPALAAFVVATCLEVAGYFIPWVDNLLDTIATPAAIVAGVMVMASAVSGMTPFLKWALAVIAGGGVAGVVHVATGVTRGASTVTTGGLGNPLVATMEFGGAMVLSLLAIALPVIAGLVVLGVLCGAAKKILGKARGYSAHARMSQGPRGEALGGEPKGRV
ncbi:MAG: DUF4126 domain-containing protein [Candidatus Methylomirabilales bacterium]